MAGTGIAVIILLTALFTRGWSQPLDLPACPPRDVREKWTNASLQLCSPGRHLHCQKDDWGKVIASCWDASYCGEGTHAVIDNSTGAVSCVPCGSSPNRQWTLSTDFHHVNGECADPTECLCSTKSAQTSSDIPTRSAATGSPKLGMEQTSPSLLHHSADAAGLGDKKVDQPTGQQCNDNNNGWMIATIFTLAASNIVLIMLLCLKKKLLTCWDRIRRWVVENCLNRLQRSQNTDATTISETSVHEKTEGKIDKVKGGEDKVKCKESKDGVSEENGIGDDEKEDGDKDDETQPLVTGKVAGKSEMPIVKKPESQQKDHVLSLMPLKSSGDQTRGNPPKRTLPKTTEPAEGDKERPHHSDECVVTMPEEPIDKPMKQEPGSQAEGSETVPIQAEDSDMLDLRKK